MSRLFLGGVGGLVRYILLGILDVDNITAFNRIVGLIACCQSNGGKGDTYQKLQFFHNLLIFL